MKLRLLSALAALILALVGGILITSYVQSADQRALDGTATRHVFVVMKATPAGTTVADLPSFISLRAVPVTAMADGSLDSLTSATNMVTSVDLVPGEQLLRTRLIDPSTFLTPGTVRVPVGLQEVTVLLGPDRAVGATVRAGATVGVFVSFPVAGAEPAVTRLVFQRVLVTNVQGAPAPPAPVASGAAAVPGATVTATVAAPTGSVLITFAVSATDAEKLIFSAQFGAIWLTTETPTTATTVSNGATQANLFQ